MSVERKERIKAKALSSESAGRIYMNYKKITCDRDGIFYTRHNSPKKY